MTTVIKGQPPSQWSLTFEVRKRGRHAQISELEWCMSQWSLTFEVRKRMAAELHRLAAALVAMEPDL